MEVLIIGFFLSMAFSLAIGNQNIFLLQKSILKNNPLPIAATIIFSDFLLKIMGIFLLSYLYKFNNQLAIFITATSSLLLLSYGWNAFLKALHFSNFSLVNIHDNISLKQNIFTTLKLKFFNPKTYLDSFIIVASLGLYFNTIEKYDFLIGSILASTTWYLIVIFKPKYLLQKLEKRITWVIIETSIGILVWIVAFYLIKSFIDTVPLIQVLP